MNILEYSKNLEALGCLTESLLTKCATECKDISPIAGDILMRTRNSITSEIERALYDLGKHIK